MAQTELKTFDLEEAKKYLDKGISEQGRKATNEKLEAELSEKITNELNMKVKKIEETERGYVFYTYYNVKLAEYKYGSSKIVYNRNAYQEYQAASENARKQRARVAKRQKERRQFALQTSKVVAKFAAGAIAAVMVFNMVTSTVETITTKHQEAIGTYTTSYISNYDVDDVIILRWADYSLDKFKTMAEESGNEITIERAQMLHDNCLMEMYREFYAYKELLAEVEKYRGIMSDEAIASMEEKAQEHHSNFMERVEDLAGYLGKSYSFDASPFKDAIAIDAPTSYDPEGKSVYIPLTNIPEEIGYDSDHLPNDAMIQDGKVYIPSYHLYDSPSQEVSRGL